MMRVPIYTKTDLHFAHQEGDGSLVGFADFISQLNDYSEELEEGAEKGIVAKVHDEGTKRLSEKQLYILNKIVERYDGKECSVCGEKIPLGEVLLMRTDMCSYHQYKAEKGEL